MQLRDDCTDHGQPTCRGIERRFGVLAPEVCRGGWRVDLTCFHTLMVNLSVSVNLNFQSRGIAAMEHVRRDSDGRRFLLALCQEAKRYFLARRLT